MVDAATIKPEHVAKPPEAMSPLGFLAASVWKSSFRRRRTSLSQRRRQLEPQRLMTVLNPPWWLHVAAKVKADAAEEEIEEFKKPPLAVLPACCRV